MLELGEKGPEGQMIDEGLVPLRYTDLLSLCTNLDLFPPALVELLGREARMILEALRSSADGGAGYEWLTERDLVALMARQECNSFGIWSMPPNRLSYAVGVYPRSSFFNHSCKPNMIKHVQRDTLKHSFFTIEDVKAGTELCFAYVNPCEPRAVRQAHIRALYYFDCSCPRCDPAYVPVPAVEVKMAELGADY